MKRYDYSLLRGRIRQIFFTEKIFVKALNEAGTPLSIGAWSNKINNKSDFSVPEMEAIMNVLEIPKEQIADYFFTHQYE